jgi:pullulanase/glycogen debranching enzyme
VILENSRRSVFMETAIVGRLFRHFWKHKNQGKRPFHLALYAYRVYGPCRPKPGKRFNPDKFRIYPYAKAITEPINWNGHIYGYNIGDLAECLSFNASDNASFMPGCAVASSILE